MANAVQKYLDYVRAIGGRQEYEVRMHRPSLHPLMYGTADCVAYHLAAQPGQPVIEVVDYKNGSGVYVPVKGNVQLMYYACMVLFPDCDCTGGADTIRLTVVQPNMTMAEPARSWDVTVGFLRAWLDETLIPAMNQAAAGGYLDIGKHCQFCPAKLVCPAMQNLAVKFGSFDPDGVEALSDEALGRLFNQWRAAKFFGAAVNAEVYKRLMNRQDVPGAKLILGKSDRKWKDGAEQAAVKLFGPALAKGVRELYTDPKFLGPAGIESLPGGKAFVAEWAFKPEPGLNVAYADDPKPAVMPKDATSLLSSVPEQKLVDGLV
jgi:hypothetical protein